MHFSSTFLTLAPLALLARADLDLDLGDTPQTCRSICQPIATLGDQCDVDLPGDNNDRQEDLLELQCFCTNNSFNVASVAALCQDCIRQNQNNGNDDADDALEDINKIVRSCSFSSTSYAASAATSYIQSITVTATRPTDASQLTTTYSGAPRSTQSNSQGGSSSSSTGTGSNGAAATSSGSSDDNGNAASGQVASLLLAGGIAGVVAAALC
ncbi:unnamed protein product [Clonostachys rosea]|uniref:Protein CAP22 n=1 Tax=Bionectria ochroleuca TaxID=29856 RepID=A0ABY6UTM2_BIOOC|nr:unnamed protein product [Clonostachys rosea]